MKVYVLLLLLISQYICGSPATLNNLEEFLLEDPGQEVPDDLEQLIESNQREWQQELLDCQQHQHHPDVSEPQVLSSDIAINDPTIASTSTDQMEMTMDGTIADQEHGQADDVGPSNETKSPREHIKWQHFDRDIQEMIKSLVQDYGININAAYRYVNKGMKKGTIVDIDDFKQDCVEKWKRTTAIWGKGPDFEGKRQKKKKDRIGSQDDDATIKVLNYPQDEYASEEVPLPCPSESPIEVIDRESLARFKLRSSSGKTWRYTKETLGILQEIQSIGMSRETARLYIEDGIQSGKIQNRQGFMDECHEKYMKQRFLLNRTGRPLKYEYETGLRLLPSVTRALHQERQRKKAERRHASVHEGKTKE